MLHALTVCHIQKDQEKMELEKAAVEINQRLNSYLDQMLAQLPQVSVKKRLSAFVYNVSAGRALPIGTRRAIARVRE